MTDASIVIPVKGLVSGKSRLAATLSPDERTALNRRLADHALTTALEAAAATRVAISVYLLSPDKTVANIIGPHAAHFLHQTTSGLNAGLSEAAAQLPVCRTVFLAADLPTLTKVDLEPLLDTKGICLAPDQGQTGTNALSVPGPDTLPFSFGPGSLELHLQAAQKTGLPVDVIRRSGLAIDLDTKEDLEQLKGWP